MQEKLTSGPLLDENGNLVQAGYATSLVKQYNRLAIKAKKSRIKEWDYYYVGNSHHGFAVTIADNSYMGMGSVSFLDFDNVKDIVSKITPVPGGVGPMTIAMLMNNCVEAMEQ